MGSRIFRISDDIILFRPEVDIVLYNIIFPTHSALACGALLCLQQLLRVPRIDFIASKVHPTILDLKYLYTSLSPSLQLVISLDPFISYHF